MSKDRPTAIVRGVPTSYSQCLIREVPLAEIDVVRAREQHAAYVRTLVAEGHEVLALPTDDKFPDCCFIEDTAVLLDDLALITRPGATSRQGEIEAVEAVLSRFRKTIRMEAPATLDGGDVLRLGMELFVGASGRTNSEGVAQISDVARSRGFRVTPVPVGNTLHLKSAVTAVDDETILLARGLVDEAPFQHLRQLEVPGSEISAANVLRLPGTGRLMVQKGADATCALLARAGFRVTRTDISEFSKGDAGLTCLSLILTDG